MPTIYMYIQDTLADWEPGHGAGRTPSRPVLASRPPVPTVLCGRTSGYDHHHGKGCG